MTSIQKRVSAGLNVTTLSRDSVREHFITMVPEGDETPESLFRRVGEVVRRLNGRIVSVEALGMAAADRIVNFFPPDQHSLIFNQLSFFLKAVISMRLLPRSDTEGMIPVCEIMTLSPTISSLINKHNIWDIPQHMASGQIYDMITFNQYLWKLIKEKKITKDLAIEYSDEKENLLLTMKKENYTF